MVYAERETTQRRIAYILPLCVSVSLFISCMLVSQKKYFWTDEFLSFYLINDQRFAHMIQALTDTINNSPPLYFTLGWAWAKVFPPTELSLRLFSSVGISLAQFLVWLTLRRTYTLGAASFGAVAVFCGSALILEQNAEARFYGLFLAVCALGLSQFDLLCRRAHKRLGVIAVNIVIHILMIQTHIYGLLYSAAILVALCIRDKYAHVFRPRVYLSIVVAWISLLPWLPALLSQAEIGKPRSWMPNPGPKGLADAYDAFTISYVFPILLIISGLAFLYHSQKDYNGAKQEPMQELQSLRIPQTHGEVDLLILALCWLGVPILAWVISQLIEPIFWKRYVIPSQMSLAILLAAWVSRIIMLIDISKPRGARFPLGRLLPVVIMSLCCLMVLYPIYYGKEKELEQLPGLRDKDYGYDALPIVVESMHHFVKRFHYSAEQSRYHFPLDWQVALDKTSGLMAPGEYKIMDALRRNYPSIFRNNITQSQEFLHTHERFLVLKERNLCTPQHIVCSKWYEIRISNNVEYSLKKLGDVGVSMDIWLVEKRHTTE